MRRSRFLPAGLLILIALAAAAQPATAYCHAFCEPIVHQASHALALVGAAAAVVLIVVMVWLGRGPLPER